MTADDETDFGVVEEDVEDGVDFGSGDSEDYSDASIVERFD